MTRSRRAARSRRYSWVPPYGGIWPAPSRALKTSAPTTRTRLVTRPLRMELIVLRDGRHREGHLNARAPSGSIRCLNRAPMPGDDRLHDRQAQTAPRRKRSAGPRLINLVETVEYVGQMLWW